MLHAQVLTGSTDIAWYIHDRTDEAHQEGRLRDVADRERAIADRLRDLDAMRNTFLLAVSHDLRAPLAAIAALADVLQERTDRLSEADARTALAHIKDSAVEVMTTLTNLLDVGRLSAGVVQVAVEPVDVTALIERTLGRFDDGRHAFEIDLAEVTAYGDGVLIERVLENLFRNALVHTPEGSTLFVRCCDEPDGVLVEVADNGPGIPDDAKRTIFHLYETGPTKRPTGLGIGLWLVRRLTELQGGFVTAVDRPGGGAAFHVVLPNHPPGEGDRP
jgi:two-component system sensor histidine kinase KdpD